MATGSTRRRHHHLLRPLPLLLILLLLAAGAGNGKANAAATGDGARPSPIKNVVVLALENRSFDHMLGWMRRLLGLPIDGLTGAECNPNSTASNATTTTTTSSICVSADADLVVPDDPGHSFEDVLEQVFGNISASAAQPSMSGFVRSALSVNAFLSSAVMRAFRPSLLPAFSALAPAFAVFDRWFSSIPGPTQPNRLFLYSATSRGAVAHDKLDLLLGYPQRTIFDSLAADGREFAVYFKTIPTVLFYRRLRALRYAARSFHHYDSTFKDHARRGVLPALSVIEPRYFDLTGTPADDDHPAHDVANGQRLVKDVYEALRASPQWNQTLLIVTYDEHGGFYDHVATPTAGVPSPDGIRGPPPFFFKFDRLGVRVPTIMVSPWIKKGTVVGRPVGPTDTSEFEHSSIPATLKKIFSLSSDFLTKRDAWAGTFEHIFTELDQPRTDCPETLPEVPFERPSPAKENGWLSDFQRELLELASFLNGDYMLTSLAQETRKKMTVKQADAYVRRAITSFLQASKQAKRLGANESAIVTMRPSLTSKSSSSSP
ncbi:non-specific phospholipase C6-like [Phragmites australis]|uniref:non-specific phospholipase C6-like n=1 Tax=Phragmites australis TaxID=29695 RepID=UPI002D7758AA|nr:non-specific phospholipase C6-like [Phragmites australis]